jgi:hypothetical protein
MVLEPVLATLRLGRMICKLQPSAMLPVVRWGHTIPRNLGWCRVFNWTIGSCLQALSRGEKLHLAHLLLEDLAKGELPTVFKEGQIYPIYTPEYAPGAAAQLAQLLKGEGTRS